MFQFKRNLVTRGYELDARRRIPASTLARYQEHARWQAVAAPEFGLAGLTSRGFKTVIRAQQLDVFEQLVQDVELTLSTTIAHVGRTSLRLVHRVTRAADGCSVAVGGVSAVLLNPEGQPSDLPERLRALVQAEPTLDTLPADTPAPDGAWSHPVQVRPSDLDALQHVNQARYLDFCEDARQFASELLVYGPGAFWAGSPLKGVAVEYLREVVVGCPLECATWRIGTEPPQLGFELRDASCGVVVARARFDLQSQA